MKNENEGNEEIQRRSSETPLRKKFMETELYQGHAEDQRKREELAARIERAHAAVLPGALREAFGSEPCRIGVPPVSGEKEKPYTLQPVTLGLTANLERIKSPLLDVVRIMRQVFSSPAQPLNENPERVEDARESEKGSEPNANADRLLASPSPGGEGEINPRFELIKQKISELKFDEEQIAETVFVFTRPQKRVRKLLDAGRGAFREAAMDELGDKLHPTQMAALQRVCAQHYVASFATIIGYNSPPDRTEGGGHEVSFPPPSPSGATGSVGG